MKSVIHSSCPSISSLPARCGDKAFLVEATLPCGKAGVHRKGWQLSVIPKRRCFIMCSICSSPCCSPPAFCLFIFLLKTAFPFPSQAHISIDVLRAWFLTSHWALWNLRQHYFTIQDGEVTQGSDSVYLTLDRLTWIQGVGHDRGLGDEIGGVTIWPKAWGAGKDMMVQLVSVVIIFKF